MRALAAILFLLLAGPALAAWQVQYRDLPPHVQQPLLRQFPRLAKEKINRAEMDDIIHWLHENMEADHVSFTEDGPNQVKLEVRRLARIGQINFYGLSAVIESEARSYLGFNRNDPFDEQILLESGERLRQAYKELGYLNAEIDVEMPTDEHGLLTLNFRVRENKRTEIRDINFEISNAETKADLSRKSRKYRDKAYTDSTLNDLGQTLREQLNEDGRYLTEIVGPEARFNAEETQVDLFYKFDKTEKFEIDIKGEQAFTKAYLLDDVLDMKNYNSANPNLATEITQKLKTFYLQQGFARVDIRVEDQESVGPSGRRLSFLVDEGAKIKIEKYVITGKYSRPEEFYAEFIRKNSTPLIKKNAYNKEDLEKGYANLISYLHNQGHLLAKLVSSRTQYNRAKDRLTVYINLDEGPVTLVDTIQFVGQKAFGQPELLALTALKPGEPLRLNLLETALQNLKNFYYDQGFIEMMLLNEKADLVTYSPDNTRARIRFEIFEGPKVFVNSIVLDGNYFTKDYVILNELDLKVGEIITPAKADESKTRLLRTGYFSSVDIKTLEEKTNVSQRTLLVRVTERDPGTFSMGFGATNEHKLTLRGYTGIGYSNLYGTGRGISLRLEGNYNVADREYPYLENRITLGYLEPYLLDSRVRGRLSLSRSKTVTDYELHKVTEVNQTTTSVEKDFTTHILGIWDILSVATVRDFYLAPNIDQDTLVNIASTGPTVQIDYRDNPLNPTRGHYSSLSTEYASPGLGSSETITYWRAMSTFKHYAYLAAGPWVWANQFQAGYIENLNQTPDGGVPYDKKGFVLGGRSTIRGYEAGTSEVFPSRFDLGTDQFIMKTRARMGLIKTELRFPLWGNFGGAVFYDGGYVQIEGVQFKDYYRDSTGFALRYNTPVGPLSLEWGWKLDRRENEEPWRFHLSIGTF